MSNITGSYVHYDQSVEQKQDQEEQTITQMNELIHRTQVLLNDRYRHAVRFVHSKSHGILKGELAVKADLPAELRQGLFSVARMYPTIIRFSTAPGDIMADSVSTPRGMAVKVVGVEGWNGAGQRGAEHAGLCVCQFQGVWGSECQGVSGKPEAD